jgi:hypothetical protein
MKVTIELSAAQVKGIREYLKSVSHDVTPKITADDIKEEIRGMVSCEMSAGAVGDYIRQAEKESNL